MTDGDDLLVESIDIRLLADDPGRTVRQRQVVRTIEEPFNLRVRRTTHQEHIPSRSGLPNSPSRINSSTAITNRRIGGRRSVSAADGRSWSVSLTSASV